MKLLVMFGDGIGEEITRSTISVLNAVDKRFQLGLGFEYAEIGLTALQNCGTTLPAGTLELARQFDGLILGPISHLDYPPRDQGGVNVSAEFRVGLDLYANIRPARTRIGLPSSASSMDLVIMRENTEGFYSDRNMIAGTGEFMPTEDMALSVRKITANACRRIAQKGFELASVRKKRVTAVHKANCFRLSDGLFLREVRKVAENFPEVELEEVIVDAMSALLVRRPESFDVVVTTNFYGDILSDLASELSGSLGLAGSLLAGTEQAAAQAQHGSAPDIAGQDKANPVSLILSAAMLLSWWGEKKDNGIFVDAAEKISTVIDTLLQKQETRTTDVGGTLGTMAFTDFVVRRIEE